MVGSEQNWQVDEIMTIRRTKKDFRKKTVFAVWLNRDLHQWFTEYLNKVSYGPTKSEKFRVFLT
jgi:hypothetical protein